MLLLCNSWHMKNQKVNKKQIFIGREAEIKRLNSIINSEESAIISIYGRRRVGKTALIEHVFQKRKLLKFEGVEKKPEEFQKQTFLNDLANYTGKSEIAKLPAATMTWIEIFKLLAEFVKKGTWTIYFEELQWMACYEEGLIAELKSVWDNYFRKNNKLILILCGSSPSFFIKHIIRSKSLYNRSMHEMHIEEFSIKDIHNFLGKRSLRDTFDAYLSVGGIPEYLKILKRESSTYLGLVKESFITDGFFLGEFEKIFISSFASSELYRSIINELSKNRFLTRNDILNKLSYSSSSGGVSQRLIDLELTGFIDRYNPVNNAINSGLSRYTVKDCYLNFYFKFISPLLNEIKRKQFVNNQSIAMSNEEYMKWLGLQFEKYCRFNSSKIAEKLGFIGIKYSSGALFSRSLDRKNTSGFQIDLMFKRQDRVWTICEIKYRTSPADYSVVREFDLKILGLNVPKNITLQKVLVSASGATQEVLNSGYFDKVLTLEDLI